MSRIGAMRRGWGLAPEVLSGIGAFLVCLCTAGAWAQPEEVPGAEARGAKRDDGEKHQFWFIGTSNYHLRLRESEDDIDRMLNNTLGRILPRWENPTTFKDWSDDWRIWDLWIGYGRDIHPRSSWSVYTGGGEGTVYNTERYLPLKPLKLDVDFTRRSILLGSSVSYYPFGRPEKTGRGLVQSLKDTRPVAEINVGYTRQTSIADVTAGLPVLGNVLHIKDEKKYNLFWTSPRLGAEVPITQVDTLNVLAGYLFFLNHGDEFDGVLLEFFVRHRF